MTIPHLNLVLAWSWILLGFLSGMVLGLNFHREDWLGGYGSFARRLCRLGHISFFGLGTINLFFYLTVRTLPAIGAPGLTASWAFILGAVAMPICCFVTAFKPELRSLFAIPVVSLISGGSLFLWELIKL
jgi:hypothetical protein